MNYFFTGRGTKRGQGAFTLVELLVVIAIIGLLAALVVGGAGIASIKARTYRVQAERDALVTAIEQYKGKMGFYPPDNTNNSAVSPLYYELTGVSQNPQTGNFTAVSGETLTPTQVNMVFNLGTANAGGFINSSSDPAQPAKNFFGAVGKAARTTTYYVSGNSGNTFTLFGVAVPPGPPPAPGFPYSVAGTAQSPWHYVSSNPTNNPSEFDLWLDVSWAGKTNRISNWSKDPQVVTH